MKETGFRDWNNTPVINWWGNFFNECFRDFFNPVIVFCKNYNQDKDVESKVLENVGSYGFQLGIILDALDVFEDKIFPLGSEERSKLPEADQHALCEFDKLYKDVTEAVTDSGRGSLKKRKKLRRLKME